MMLRVYSAALVIVEIPTILGLLQGQGVSEVSEWFTKSDDVAALSAVYAAFLMLLCVSRTSVISYPTNRGVLFQAAAVHAVEIPLFFKLFFDMKMRGATIGWMPYVLLPAIVTNPLFFLQAALRAKKRN